MEKNYNYGDTASDSKSYGTIYASNNPCVNHWYERFQIKCC